MTNCTAPPPHFGRKSYDKGKARAHTAGVSERHHGCPLGTKQHAARSTRHFLYEDLAGLADDAKPVLCQISTNKSKTPSNSGRRAGQPEGRKSEAPWQRRRPQWRRDRRGAAHHDSISLAKARHSSLWPGRAEGGHEDTLTRPPRPAPPLPPKPAGLGELTHNRRGKGERVQRLSISRKKINFCCKFISLYAE